jgi:hypothetical protein
MAEIYNQIEGMLQTGQNYLKGGQNTITHLEDQASLDAALMAEGGWVGADYDAFHANRVIQSNHGHAAAQAHINRANAWFDNGHLSSETLSRTTAIAAAATL